MPAITLPRNTWLKPPAGATIDWSHPLARGLVFATVLNENGGQNVRDLVTGLPSSGIAGDGWVANGINGPGYKLANGTSSKLDWGIDARWDVANAFTASVLWQTATMNDGSLLGKFVGSPSYLGWMIWTNAGSVRNYINAAARATSATTLSTNTWYRITTVWDGATAYIYINGRLDASAAYAVAPTSVGLPLRMGNYQAGADSQSGIYSDCFFWNRALNKAEIQSLQVAPYSMLKATARIWAVRPLTLIDNLQCYLRFDEASGNFADASGNSNTGVPSGSPTRPAGVVGNGVHLVSGSTQYVEIADAATVRFDHAFTLGFWFKLANKSSTKWMLNKGNSAGTICEMGFNYNSGSDRLTFFVGAGGSQKTAVANNFGSPTAGVWYYALLDFDPAASAGAGAMSVSINNGTPDVTTTVPTPVGGTQTLVLGGFSGHDFLADVDFDEFGKWDRILTSAERASLYNAGAGFAYPFVAASFVPYRSQMPVLIAM